MKILFQGSYIRSKDIEEERGERWFIVCVSGAGVVIGI